jgi:hypothetical protein
LCRLHNSLRLDHQFFFTPTFGILPYIIKRSTEDGRIYFKGGFPLQLGNNCRFMWLSKSADRLNMLEYRNKGAVRHSRFYLQNFIRRAMKPKNLIAFLDCGKSGRGGGEHYCIYRDYLSVCLSVWLIFEKFV